ncbi:hypothetical protein [Planomonospora sp. ID82291]|uniref:hypothetical protein n=1 Tax=Planomonospora sp. ID82291 TaxID=2738136 RepID=UPI0018C3EF67|nr:hypothetical protein [Planomonospora sp. ID82291]MBG0818945.1 hypothetical protein [Planomonospora sp. ID82291]
MRADNPGMSLWFVTLGGGRRLLRRITLYGEHLGLTVTHQHDGALLFRHHRVTAAGPDRTVRRFFRTVDRVLSSERKRKQEQSRADLLARLRGEA